MLLKFRTPMLAVLGGWAVAGAAWRPMFAGDLGPAEVDVSSYPKPIQEGYQVFQRKCSVCHTPARALNSPFVELSEVERRRAVKAQPALEADPRIWKMEEGIWKRYVKRMASKSGGAITTSEAVQIWAFLVYDGKARKIGDRAAEWRAHRVRLLQDFRRVAPARYQERYGDSPLPKAESRSRAELFDPLGPASLSRREGWKKFLYQLSMKIPCCSFCIVVTKEEAPALLESMLTKTSGFTAKEEMVRREFRKQYPKRWALWYGNPQATP